MFQFSYHLVSSFYEAKCFWSAKDGRSGSAGKADAGSVETTAYALLSALSLRDKPTAKLTANWLTEQRKYGGGFQSTQVGCGILTIKWLSVKDQPPPIHTFRSAEQSDNAPTDKTEHVTYETKF